MKALALAIIVIASVLIVFGRFRRNNPVAIVGFAVLAVGLILGLLSRRVGRFVDGPQLTTVRIRDHADVELARDPGLTTIPASGARWSSSSRVGSSPRIVTTLA